MLPALTPTGAGQPHAASWMANKFQSAMPDALLGTTSSPFRLSAGPVTATIDEPRGGKANQVSCCDGILALRRGFGSEDPQRGPGDEVALQIECVVDGGMDAEEALRGSS